MKLILATVECCGSDGCNVKMLNSGRSLTARYSALVINRVKIRPGQLVAIDIDPVDPEIVWRWFRGRVNQTTETGAHLDDRGCRKLYAENIPGLASDLKINDEVWFTRIDADWEIHTAIVNAEPTNADQVDSLVLPRIAEALAKISPS